MTAPFVHTSALRTHASALHGTADQLAASRDKGAGVDLGFDTYGVIGQFFAGGARDAVSAAAGALANASSGLDALADAVTATAEAYDRTEDDNTVSFQVGG